MSLAALDRPAQRWRVLDAAHQKRNMAEYEGFLEVEDSDITDYQKSAPAAGTGITVPQR